MYYTRAAQYHAFICTSTYGRTYHTMSIVLIAFSGSQKQASVGTHVQRPRKRHVCSAVFSLSYENKRVTAQVSSWCARRRTHVSCSSVALQAHTLLQQPGRMWPMLRSSHLFPHAFSLPSPEGVKRLTNPSFKEYQACTT